MKHTTAELVTKDPKDWYVYYQYINPETGLYKPFKVRDGINRIKNLKEKRAFGADLVAKMNKLLKDGWSPFVTTNKTPDEFSKLTLIEVIDKMLEIKAPELRKDTNRTYKSARNLLVNFLTYNGLESIKPRYFTSVNAQAYSDYLITIQKHANVTHNNALASISPVFSLLKDRKIIDENPFIGIPRKKETEKRTLYYDNDQKKIIKDHLILTKSPLYLFVQCEFYCFIRPKELCMIQVKHIDFKNQMFIVPGEVSKNTKNGMVHIHNDLFRQIKKTYSNLDPETYLFGKGLVPNLSPTKRDEATKAHRKMLDGLDFDSKHKLYDWKHTGARLFIISGRNPYDLMMYMRHSSLDETMAYLGGLGVNVSQNKIDPKAWTF